MTGPAVPPPPPLTRAAHGRWIGGVCAGIAQARAVPVAAVRVAFAAVACVGGLGVLAYLAWWLIVPAEGEEDAPRARPLAALVLAGAGAVGLATLAALAAAATVFGLGWIVLVVAAVVLVAALASWERLGPSWALLPVGALALPSVALAAGGVHLARQTADQQFAPRAVADFPAHGYRSGLGETVIDLRRTRWPRTGTVDLRIDGGVRRTIVALPHGRCVPVSLDFDIHTFATRAVWVLTGRSSTLFSAVSVFGNQRWGGSGHVMSVNDRHAPLTLNITFTSAGGGLYVRDYPDDVDPRGDVDWPGFPYGYMPAPDTRGEKRAVAKRRLARWRVAHKAEVRRNHRVTAQRPGPCASGKASA
ncbi:MAG TPA: PspC domain-containing protein [Baekduia sp.]|uniref:PspC domain-containing protein n=1 Tax=Baekduia sp. TaxID=2600305 RepID=UPI002D78C63C|nr:PspC domain-containing protein [Baekduia sp.]HET6509344.1 PspC domain-containing protein [Baekduia sp.]